jgi:peptidoglycan/LPS O-acetylase OafA/YrhL
MSKKNLPQLNAYRAIAALSVCGFHFNIDSFFHNDFAIGWFYQLFFALSGFVIYLNYHEKLTTIDLTKRFIKKRFLRTYPLHLFFLIIFVIIEAFKYFIFLSFEIEANNEAYSKNNLEHFFYNFLFIQHFGDYFSYNGPSWSVSIEWILYFTFGILIFLVNKNLFLKIILIYTLIFLFFFKDYYQSQLGLGGTLGGFYSFSLGCLSCYMYIKFNIDGNKFLFKIIFWFFYFYLFFELFFLKDLSNIPYMYSLLFGLLFFLTSYVRDNSMLYKVFFNPLLMLLGKLSYSIYLSHLFVFWSLTQVCRFVLKFPTKTDALGKNTVLDMSYMEANILCLVAYFFTFILSYFTFNYIEMKFYKK